ENFSVFDFSLDSEDLTEIAKIDRNQRIFDVTKLFGIPVFD
ncbi:MAG: hypothetical protein EZS28_055648, partial [Streblomastix strix]